MTVVNCKVKFQNRYTKLEVSCTVREYTLITTFWNLVQWNLLLQVLVLLSFSLLDQLEQALAGIRPRRRLWKAVVCATVVNYAVIARVIGVADGAYSYTGSCIF